MSRANCRHCGESFIPYWRGPRVYCSRTCATRAANKAARQRPENKEKSNRYRRQRHQLTKLKAVAAKGGKCLDCGNDDLRVLEFDHVPERGRKIRNVAAMFAKTSSLSPSLEDELAKCDLVCANCHAVRTFTRGQRSKYHVTI